MEKKDLLEDISEFLVEEYLVNVDFGPVVNDVFHNLETFFLSHFYVSLLFVFNFYNFLTRY